MPHNVKHAGLRLPVGRQAQPGLSAGRDGLRGCSVWQRAF